MHPIFALFAVSFIEFFGNSNFKKYAQGGSRENLAAGFLFYSIMIYFLLQAFKTSNLIYVNTMWDAISTIISAGLAFILLNEIPSAKQILGIILIVSGIIFMEK